MAVASSQRSFTKPTGTGDGVCVLHGIAAPSTAHRHRAEPTNSAHSCVAKSIFGKP